MGRGETASGSDSRGKSRFGFGPFGEMALSDAGGGGEGGRGTAKGAKRASCPKAR